MKKSEVDKLNMQKFEGIFTPNYSYTECLAIKNEDGEVIDYEYTDFMLIKSAEEVYQEFLNPIPQVPQQDLQKAKLEIATLDLLKDLGVI